MYFLKSRFQATSGVTPIASLVYLTVETGAVPAAGASAIPKLSLNSLVSVGKTNQPPSRPSVAPHGAVMEMVKEKQSKGKEEKRRQQTQRTQCLAFKTGP